MENLEQFLLRYINRVQGAGAQDDLDKGEVLSEELREFLKDYVIDELCFKVAGIIDDLVMVYLKKGLSLMAVIDIAKQIVGKILLEP